MAAAGTPQGEAAAHDPAQAAGLNLPADAQSEHPGTAQGQNQVSFLRQQQFP